MNSSEIIIHQNGELQNASKHENEDIDFQNSSLSIETFGGRVHVEWDPQAAVTPLGQFPFFIEFLKISGLLSSWIEDCPLQLTSPNAPSKRDILGTLLLSILAGHTRYAHITTIRCDGVNPGLLGMNNVISEDSMRRSLLKIPEKEGIEWLQKYLKKCYEPLLSVPWILDVDTTVKVLYGKQEGAVVGYNPKKPGRPAHIYHSFFIGNLRLALDVDVQAGNQMSSSFTASELWSLLERIPRNRWPKFLRGDCGFGTDGVMNAAEEKRLPYLFKLKRTANVKRLISEMTLSSQSWTTAGQGWEGREELLQLNGWKKCRRVIVLRKPLKKKAIVTPEQAQVKQLVLDLGMACVDKKTEYDYAVLITSLSDEILTIAQHYRDRADCENVFDELKNQWGWGGFVTQDLARCQLLSRAVALIYNWWNLYSRLADPDKHLEAKTSRPLLLYAVAKQTTHAGQAHLKVTSTHGRIDKVKKLLGRITSFFKSLKDNAEQLTEEECWYCILSKALEKYLNGLVLKPPILLSGMG